METIDLKLKLPHNAAVHLRRTSRDFLAVSFPDVLSSLLFAPPPSPSLLSFSSFPPFTGAKGERSLFAVRAYPAETNDRAHKVGSKKHRSPSLKLIYVTIIFNNAKRARTIQWPSNGNFLRAFFGALPLLHALCLLPRAPSPPCFFSVFSLIVERRTADGSGARLTSLDSSVD